MQPPYTAKGNDRESDCVFASLANLRDKWFAQIGAATRVADAAVIETYRKYSPNDSGYNVLESLKRWRKDQFWNGGQWYYCAIEPLDIMHVHQAIHIFGGLHTGAMIPRDWMSSNPWDIAGNGRYGHSMAAVGYDATHIQVRSWPDLYWVSNEAWAKYFDEAFAIIHPGYLDARGNCPAGLDLPSLVAAAHSLAQP
jgi:hypothetical protein